MNDRLEKFVNCLMRPGFFQPQIFHVHGSFIPTGLDMQAHGCLSVFLFFFLKSSHSVSSTYGITLPNYKPEQIHIAYAGKFLTFFIGLCWAFFWLFVILLISSQPTLVGLNAILIMFSAHLELNF